MRSGRFSRARTHDPLTGKLLVALGAPGARATSSAVVGWAGWRTLSRLGEGQLDSSGPAPNDEQETSVTIQPIRLLGDPVLRTPAAEVVDFDKELRGLVGDLWDTMENQGGAGIAAPQIGIGLRVFTYHCDGVAGHMVNPTFEA